MDLKPLTDILVPSLAVYRYSGFGGIDSQCGIRALRLYDRTTVVLSELADNPGTSVTNRAELIATQLLADKVVVAKPAELRFIEHYPPGRGISRSETFDWVEFDYDRAGRCFEKLRWRRLTSSELEDLRAAMIQEAH